MLWLDSHTSWDRYQVSTASLAGGAGSDLSAALLLLILETQNDYVRFHGKHILPVRRFND